MNNKEFIAHMNSGKEIIGGSAIHNHMINLSYEAMKITAEINNKYNEPITHPGWKENLALGLKLQVQLEKQYPGLCRPLALRAQRYNQDLLPGAILVEVGTAGNTWDQAMASIEPLARSILSLAKGTEPE